MIANIKWTDAGIIGPVIAAIIGLSGVLLTIYFTRKKGADKAKNQQQSSSFSKKSRQYQAGRDININGKGKK